MTDDEALEAMPTITDDELARLALAADPEPAIREDAVPLSELLGGAATNPLPSWYMPAPMGARRPSGWRGLLVRCSAASLIAAFAVITASGLCNTYGQLHL